MVERRLFEDLVDSDVKRHTTGKSCLYIKRLADVDQVVLKRMIEDRVKAAKSLAG